MSPPSLSEQSGQALLRLARRAIEAHLAGDLAPPAPEADELLVHSGAFVSLHARPGGALRGCVGFVEPLYPLAEAVSKAAVAAACEDPRFAPVTPSELPSLAIDVSVLGPTLPIRPDDVKVGVHGLVLRHRGLGGLLLPQVPVEHGWDRTTFLEQLCHKVGLPPGSWQEPGALLLGFTAVVIREDEAAAG
jgi:AmmeMemoRadiSam system protein A